MTAPAEEFAIATDVDLDVVLRDAIQSGMPIDGMDRIDPLERLLDPNFTATTWECDQSYVGELPGSLHPKQLEILNDEARHRWLFWGNQAQPVDEHVLTPSGWRQIGDLRPGDAVIAGDGTETVVAEITWRGQKAVSRVTFDDGASTRCCDDHLWRVLDPEARFRRPAERRGDGYDRKAAGYGEWSVRSLKSIRDRWGSRPKPRRRCAIPVACAELPSRPTLIDPYALGLLIGDGGFSSGRVDFTTADDELAFALANAIRGLCVKRAPCNGKYGWVIVGQRGCGNWLIDALRSYGLFGKRSFGKFVPREYIDNDRVVRLEILQGLLDTDGTVGKRGHVDFSSVSPQLAADVTELVRSLGGKARTVMRQTFYRHRGERRAGQPSYRVHIRLPRTRLFRLERKQKRVFEATSTCDERVLYSIEPAGVAECMCIAVAHPQGTYITRDHVVTHNSGKTALGAVESSLMALGRHPLQKKGLVRMPPVTIWASALTWELWEKVLLPELLSWIPRWRIKGDPPPPFKQSTRRDIIVIGDNGRESRITGKAAQQGASAYQSARVDLVWPDEEHPEDVWDEMQPRLLRYGGRTLCTMTPLLGMTWPYGRVYEPVRTGQVERSRHYFTHAGVADNPSIKPEAITELTEELKHNPSQLASRLHGHFTRPEGVVLPWDPEKMQFNMAAPGSDKFTAADEQLLDNWRRRGRWFGAVDHGKWRFTMQFGVGDHEGVFRLIDEYFSQNESVDTRAKGIHDLLSAWKVPPTIMIPADCADEDYETGKHNTEEINLALDRIGSPYRLYPIQAAQKRVTMGIERFTSMLNRGAFLVRRQMGAHMVWRLGMDASRPGKVVMGSRWKWEISNWRYPKMPDGKIQKEEPDKASADGADMMDGGRYLVVEYFGPFDPPEKKKGAATTLQRIQQEMRAMDEAVNKPKKFYGTVLRQ